MRPQEENQDSGDVEDILEFNGEHIRMIEAQRDFPCGLHQGF